MNLNWKVLGALAVVLIVGVFLWRRLSTPTAAPTVPLDAPPRPEQRLAIGQTVVLNAMGVGKVEDFAVRPLRTGGQAWGYVIKVRSYEAFAPAEKVPGLVWPLCDRPTAEAMEKAILEPDTSQDPPSPDERKARMIALWGTGSHLEQARMLGQVLRAASPEDSAIVIGSGHILREIAYVLGIKMREMDARIEARFPKWRAHLPPRDPDDL